jgi:hypothetical protein
MVEVVDCGTDEELIVDTERKKSLIGWKRIVGSIPYEKLCLEVLMLHTACLMSCLYSLHRERLQGRLQHVSEPSTTS